MPQNELPVLPVGLALLYQSAQTFLGIFQTVELIQENVHRMLETIAQGEAQAAEDGFFRHGKHRSGVAVDAIHEVVDGFVKLRVGNETIDHAQVEGEFSSHGFAGEDKFEGDFWANKEWQNGRRERRKNTDADFRLGETRFGSGNDEVPEGCEFRAAADGRPIHDTNDGFAKFQHAGEGGVEGVEHLEDALGGVFTDVDASAKDFAGGIKDDQFDFVARAGVRDAVSHFAKHGFVEKIVLRAGKSHSRDTAVATQLDEFKLFRRAFRGCCKFFVDGLDHLHTPVDHCPW